MNVAQRLERALRPVVHGELPVRLIAWDGSAAGPEDAPRVVLNSPDALRRIIWSPGELGAAQAYVTGEIDVDGDLHEALAHVWQVARERNLTGLRVGPADAVRLLVAGAQFGALRRPLPAPSTQANVRGRLHSLVRDRAAISHHYDLSNDFYSLILDPQMAYSCAYFTRNAPGAPDDPDYGIADAQLDKFDLVCRKLGLGRPGMRLLDVGCGWGSLSLHAAQHYDAQVVGVTISREQQTFIEARVRERGLTDRVDIRLQDYREIADGPFDAVVSLEMGEHVGEKNYAVYAKALHDNAVAGARVLIQQMSRTGRHPGGGPFIESFIAPDMTMRPVGETVAYLERAGLEVRDVHALREHYVWTVQEWLRTFESRWDDVVAMVGPEMARVWRLYLVGGALSFEQGRMGVDQILSVKPYSSGMSTMPAVRSDASVELIR